MRGGDLSVSIVIEEEDERRHLGPDDLPLSIGGPEADISVPRISGAEPVAWIGADEDEIFVQPSDSATAVRCNGEPLQTSRWLRSGDVVTLGASRIEVADAPDGTRLRVEHEAAGERRPPRLTPPPRRSESAAAEPVMIQPAEFTPRARSTSRRTSAAGRPALLLTWLVLALLALAAWFTFTARSVELRVTPEPDVVEIRGTLLQLELGGRHLIRPGTYTVVAEKAGFRPLEEALTVSEQSHQIHELVLQRLPGLLALRTTPTEGVDVTIDGDPIGTTPLEPIELEAGEHIVELVAARHRAATATVSIEGAGTNASLDIALQPLWAPISFDSRPRGAAIRVDGEAVGTTPASVDVIEGRRSIELRLGGHKPFRDTIAVVAGEPRTLDTPTLEPVEGWLVLDTAPSGASVTIDGRYRGVSPLELELEPAVDHTVSVSLSGHVSATETVQIGSDVTRELLLELESEYGEVEIVAVPADAELLIDGESRGLVGQTVQLSAVPHRIEIRKEGYEPVTRQVTPKPGLPQTIEVELTTPEEAAAARRPVVIRTPQGQELKLIGPGSLRMGASRREPGRRANEALRDVEITRPFYLATEEVSNAEFREFRSGHRGGLAGSESLDLDDYPVVEVTWTEAARYCNWLSTKESLPPFYVERGGKMTVAQPPTNGYRLPTEAEWAWAARYAGGGPATKYPWGNSLPVAPGSGNYADASARGLVPATVQGYHDDYSATAPVDSFEPNALGIFNLGGNVAEWVHDYYTIYPSSGSGVDRDPLGPDDGEYHVVRGSSWMDSTITELRLSYRDYSNKPRADVGFRIARYAE